MRVGINAGFGASLKPEFTGLATYGFMIARQDVFADDDPAKATPLVAEFASAPVHPLYLIGGGHIQHKDGTPITPTELAAWTLHVISTVQSTGIGSYAIEIGNEPDIAHADYAEDPLMFAEAVTQCYDTARMNGFEGMIISGGVANLDERGLDYLKAYMSYIPQDMVVGFHRYPPSGSGPMMPHRPYRSREDEWDALMSAVAGRRVVCTEFGYHTAPEGPLGRARTDEEVAQYTMWDIDFFTERSVSFACVYQLNDGPGDEWLDKFGVRTVDGIWKPVADQIRALYTL